MITKDIFIVEISGHRNGVCGAPFHAIRFDWDDDGTMRSMIGTLFDAPGCCAVYEIAELAAGNIGFGCGNSWRGDNFEPHLRKAVAEYGK